MPHYVREKDTKKRSGCLIPVLIFLALAVSFTFFVMKPQEQADPIMDVPKLAGASLEELEAQYGELKYDGTVELFTKLGTTETGEIYTISGSATNFALVNGTIVNVQYCADSPISYKNQSDLLKMFGIEPGRDMKKTVGTGYALRLTNVSEDIAEVWVQTMDSSKKTFEVVKITFNAYYAA